MKVCLYTLGCKVNQYESGGLHKELQDRGFEVCDSLEPADIYIINTCAVTAEAERKSRNSITKCLALNPFSKIFAIGCAVQKNAAQFLEKDNVVYVNGNANKKKVLELIEKTQIDDISLEFEDFVSTINSRTRAFVKVQDGCNNFCSYCIVPYLRGRSRSREISSVVDEIKGLKNCNEVVLTGINLSDYKFGGLGKLAEEVDKVGMRFRFGSLEVNVITDEFLSILKNLNHFCPQFHLSLQSGSTAVLKKMNRHYTAEEYVAACDKIQSTFENANITTDVIVGFPSETDDNFNETI
ncbi:MAG: MiaB/RimO family radical SAM methylthiotransferase, partial [Clostridia bacterium]